VSKADRESRLAEALRANLRRRKQQERARAGGGGEAAASDAADMPADAIAPETGAPPSGPGGSGRDGG
jgi:hypothetical protein